VGQPVVDSISTAIGNPVLSLTWAHTINAGNNRALYVVIGMSSGNYGASCTYNGAAMSLVSGDASGNTTTDRRYDVWELINPPVGTFNVVYTTGGAQTSGISGVGLGFTDVLQSGGSHTTPNSTRGTGTTATITLAATTVATDFILSVVDSRTGTVQSHTSAGSVVQTLSFASNNWLSVGKETTNTTTWTYSPSDVYAVGLIAIHGTPTVSFTGVVVPGSGNAVAGRAGTINSTSFTGVVVPKNNAVAGVAGASNNQIIAILQAQPGLVQAVGQPGRFSSIASFQISVTKDTTVQLGQIPSQVFHAGDLVDPSSIYYNTLLGGKLATLTTTPAFTTPPIYDDPVHELVGPVPPLNPSVNDFWADTVVNRRKRWDGFQWIIQS
jgi:hypothetical protein